MDSKINSEISLTKKEDIIDSSNEIDTSICQFEDEEDFSLLEDDLFFSEEDSLEENNLAAIRFEQECNIYSVYNPNYPATLYDFNNVKFSIPSSFLPLSQQVVYGFTCHPILLDITLQLSQFDWKLEPQELQMIHPIKGTNFIGSPLIHTIANTFFSPHYKPRTYYRAQSQLFSFQSVEPDQTMLILLSSQGYDLEQARRALILANNDLTQALQLLNKGYLYNVKKIPISNFLSFKDCPLIYFVLELAEAFLDLSHCCCICRKKLSIPGVKPSICNSDLCKFSLFEIGIGISVCQEINLDPEVADLMVSIYASSFDSIFCKPPYPKSLDKMLIRDILQELPSMLELSSCQNDIELNAKVGADAFELLRWILLSHRSFIVSLPESMKMTQFPSDRQFLTLISSPEAEETFNNLRKRYGSIFLWHGSEGNRWHSILRNGLKVGSGTHFQKHGSSYGKGIYFADNSSLSWNYVRSTNNYYYNSMLGRSLEIIALCEVAKVPELKYHHNFIWTTMREEAVIVRMLIIANERFSTNLVSSPPKLPSLSEVLHLEGNIRK